ncbi:unnamed protein product [Lupinus luteus]|uniref:Uncharacterized protein n=1 Tax=Lupinus luteus TaxID=3873 RepID=A0AAV1WTI4_LUPLU
MAVNLQFCVIGTLMASVNVFTINGDFHGRDLRNKIRVALSNSTVNPFVMWVLKHVKVHGQVTLNKMKAPNELHVIEGKFEPF